MEDDNDHRRRASASWQQQFHLLFHLRLGIILGLEQARNSDLHFTYRQLKLQNTPSFKAVQLVNGRAETHLSGPSGKSFLWSPEPSTPHHQKKKDVLTWPWEAGEIYRLLLSMKTHILTPMHTFFQNQGGEMVQQRVQSWNVSKLPIRNYLCWEISRPCFPRFS